MMLVLEGVHVDIKLVESRTYSTAKPDSLIIFAVPPEAKRRTLCLIRPLAKSSNPVLS